jgi:hypothetical protein
VTTYPTIHGLRDRPLYNTWKNIRQRCFNGNSPAYEYYGGRGITVCDEWRNDVAAFISYVDETLGPRPPDRSLDRIDNDDGYRPGNVRWASRAEQSLNRRHYGSPVYRGVRPNGNGWMARFRGQYLGWFTSPEEAGRAYDAAAWAHLRDPAHLNFPQALTAKI